jgi:hypothetical protein
LSDPAGKVSGVTTAATPDTTATGVPRPAGRPPATGARAWVLGFLALALIWGSILLFIGVAVRDIHPVVGYQQPLIVLGPIKDVSRHGHAGASESAPRGDAR